MELIIGLLSGAAGGNIVAKVLKNLDQGTLINSISGVVGGGLGASLLGAVGADVSGGMDVGAIISQVAGGGVGGGVVLAVVGMLRSALGK